MDLAATRRGPGDELVQCSVHLRSRSRRNMVPDGAHGLRCSERHPCLGGVARQSKGGCPRDAATGLRVDTPVAGDLAARDVGGGDY